MLYHRDEKETRDAMIDSIFFDSNISPLFNLHRFQMIRGFIVEYMHAYLLGAGQRTADNLLTENDIIYLQQFVQHIKLPSKVRRRTAPLGTGMRFWTAKDWENFMLHYSIRLLSLVLDDKHLKYWSLLVELLHILLGAHITYEKLFDADNMVHKFVEKTENILEKKQFFSISINYFMFHSNNLI